MNRPERSPSAAHGAALADLAERPDGVLEAIAEKHGLSVREVVELLPATAAVVVAGVCFEEVWKEIRGWGEVMFLVHGRNGVLEIRTALPPGNHGRGYFNIHGDVPLGGHLRIDRCVDIVFVDRPFFGRRSLSVQFFDAEGDTMFKIFVARDAAGRLDPVQSARFEAARQAFAT